MDAPEMGELLVDDKSKLKEAREAFTVITRAEMRRQLQEQIADQKHQLEKECGVRPSPLQDGTSVLWMRR